jgi:hypothetical protein
MKVENGRSVTDRYRVCFRYKTEPPHISDLETTAVTHLIKTTTQNPKAKVKHSPASPQ